VHRPVVCSPVQHMNPSLPACLQYAADVADGMSYLHANRIIHGDLKVGWWSISLTERAPQCSSCSHFLSRYFLAAVSLIAKAMLHCAALSTCSWRTCW
jgi:serine/threonine protein kinase